MPPPRRISTRGWSPRWQTRGIEALYTHQAEAVAAALTGAHVAVVTPAASGKTLCYNLPILHRLLANPGARALYLFPTKALAQDQLAELQEFIRLSAPIRCPVSTYDGDTPSSQRAKIRDAARIILSNPDMLHAGILPQHPRWAAFFANLTAVVIDEMHVYRGVFGSHMANVMRRLRRICRFYGSNPQFILASATIANPADLAERLVEAPVTVIGPERDGAPQGEKHVLFYNPPLLDPSLGIRRSSSLEAADLAAHFLAHDVQTIVFGRARLTTELILTYLRESGSEKDSLDDQSEDIGAGICRASGGRSSRGCGREQCAGWWRPTRWSWALTSAGWTRPCWPVIRARWPAPDSRSVAPGGAKGRRWACWWQAPRALDQYVIAHPEWLLARSPSTRASTPTTR